MRIINIYPSLSEDEIRRKQKDAAMLFLNVYKAHEKNNRTNSTWNHSGLSEIETCPLNNQGNNK